MLQKDVLKAPNENIIRLRELTEKMAREESGRKSFRQIVDEISEIIGVEPKSQLAECDRLKFYERMYVQIKNLLSNT